MNGVNGAKRPIVIGVAGGTGSGKTTVAQKVLNAFSNHVVMIEQDAYYKAQDHLTMEARTKQNYDHPLAFDYDLMIDQLHTLLSNEPINKPIYDYAIHTRSSKTTFLEPKEVILIEGILILDEPRLRDLMDIKVFVDTDADVRILRRLERDIRERRRTVSSVIKQYLDIVKPMHMQFIEPSKRYADLIIPEGGHNQVAIDLLLSHIRSYLNGN